MNQQLLFRNSEETYLSIDDVANQLEVSTASVRNWVKTGYLDQTGRGVISRKSFESFKTVVAGGEKLTARANKSLKDTHDHEQLQRQFEDLLKKDKTDLDSIGLRYEESLSNAYRNKEGIYYTPIDITERLFQYLPKNNSRLSFCDPCCGSGNFILTAIENGFQPENIYGYDIDPIAVEITKRRIFRRTGYETNKIICVDFLESMFVRNHTGFDIIVTNPPWGKKIKKEQKTMYARRLHSGSSVDTSSLFLFSCLSRLNENGYLGLLLQDAFFNVASFECARKQALSLNVIALLDFGKPFKGLLTKAKGIIVQQKKSSNKGLVQCLVNQKHTVRLQNSFNRNPKSILNFACSSEESEAIDHLYKQQHLTLFGKAKYGLGIVTGNNKKFCSKEKRAGYIPVYTGADIHKDSINNPSNYVPDDLSLYQQVAPKELFMAKEKLIYRFISSKLIFYHDTQQRVFLNSVNMLVVENDFPINAKQLAKILNSRVLGWLFKSVFETYKVLRSDIESLPIHTKYFNFHSEFNEELFINYLGLEEHHNETFRIKK